MFDQIQSLAHLYHFHVITYGKLHLCTVPLGTDVSVFLKTILYDLINNRTALYITGDKILHPLYQTLAKEEVIRPGVVGLTDELFGDPYHDHSYEKMILETGLLRYFSLLDIPYYTILRSARAEDTARRYDGLYRSLLTVFPKSMSLLSLGNDGSIASILPNSNSFSNSLFNDDKKYEMVSWFDKEDGMVKQRVTITFLGFSMIDFYIVLAMGEEKRFALQKMFQDGPEEELPARFFRRPDVAEKTLLITDQVL